MSFDDPVDLGHDADGLTEGDDDLLVVGDVLVREPAALPVLEPLVADLVAADLEVPDLLGHALEADGAGLRRAVTLAGVGLAGVEPDGAVRPADAADFGVPGAGVVSDELTSSFGDSSSVEQAADKPASASSEETPVDFRHRQRHPGEIELELGSRSGRGSSGAVEHRVDPSEDVLRAAGRAEIAAATR